MTDRISSTRTVAAPPERVFAALADPNRHQHTEPGDWVRDAIDTAPIERVGQSFAVNMFFEAAGGAYVMENRVTAFEPDRVLAWMPGQSEGGEWGAGGWWWRYDLAPDGTGTRVTLTYDWTDVPESLRAEFGGLPPFADDYPDQSLAALDAHVAA